MNYFLKIPWPITVSLGVFSCFLALASCKTPNNQTVEGNDLSQTTTLDTLNRTSLNIDSLNRVLRQDSVEDYLSALDFGELEIYRLYYFGANKGEEYHFVPLTDRYRWREHSDSLVIDQKYLGEIGVVNHNYHLLDSTHRARFLSHMDIEENDRVFLFNTLQDTMESFAVKYLDLMAVLSPYSPQFPLEQYEYMIGFDMKNSSFGIHGYNLAYVGKDNPFILGEIKPMVFEEIDSSAFPMTDIRKEYLKKYQNDSVSGTYKFSTGGYDYFVQNIPPLAYMSSKHLVVKEHSTGNIVFDKLFRDSEGTYGNTTVIRGQEQKYINEIYTGAIFRNKPPVVMGFLSYSFGCEPIDFLGEEPRIYMRCDNRH